MCMNECTLLASDKISFRQFSRFWGESCPSDVLVQVRCYCASPVVHFFILFSANLASFSSYPCVNMNLSMFVVISPFFQFTFVFAFFVFVFSCICFHQFVQFWVELCPGVQFLRLLMFWRTWVQPGGSPCVKAPKVKKKSSFWQNLWEVWNQRSAAVPCVDVHKLTTHRWKGHPRHRIHQWKYLYHHRDVLYTLSCCIRSLQVIIRCNMWGMRLDHHCHQVKV